jgi:FkbM family methyltransferase
MKKSILNFAAWVARILPGWAKRLVYRIQPLARLARGSLNRVAPQGMTEVKVAAGDLQGWRLCLDMQAEKDYWLGSYEPDLQAAIIRWVKPGWVAYDVGANIGYVSLLLAKRVGESGRVFAFEALPTNLERLYQNVALNSLDERVVVVPAAVVDSQRQVQFLVGPSGGMGKAEGSAGRQEVTYTDTILVEGICLDDFVYKAGNPAPQAIKLDIEGGEVLALPGMRRILRETRPVLLMELHGPESALATWQELEQAGYQVMMMKAGYPVVPSQDALDWKAYVIGLPELSNE